MTMNNADVLENLISQRDQVQKKLQELQVNLIKIEGAIDVLQQIEESNSAESEVEQVADE